jgi:hypothetical protein
MCKNHESSERNVHNECKFQKGLTWGVKKSLKKHKPNYILEGA